MLYSSNGRAHPDQLHSVHAITQFQLRHASCLRAVFKFEATLIVLFSDITSADLSPVIFLSNLRKYSSALLFLDFEFLSQLYNCLVFDLDTAAKPYVIVTIQFASEGNSLTKLSGLAYRSFVRRE